MENYKLKKYGQILTDIFGAYFKTGFWRNFGFGALILLASIVLGIPYYVSIFRLEVNDYNMVMPIVTYVILLLACGLILPPFAISFFGLKTKDYVEGKESDPKHTKEHMFKNVGRVIGANAANALCQFVIFVVLFVLVALLVISIFPVPFAEIPFFLESMDPLNSSEMAQLFTFIGLFILILIAFSVLIYCVYVFFMFTGFISLFEKEKGFKAVGKSIKLARKKNFWITLGQIILSYIIYTACYMIVLVPFYIVIMVAAFASATMNSMALIIVAYIALCLLAIVISIMSMGIINNFAAILYFNAKVRAKDADEDTVDSIPENTVIQDNA